MKWTEAAKKKAKKTRAANLKKKKLALMYGGRQEVRHAYADDVQAMVKEIQQEPSQKQIASLEVQLQDASAKANDRQLTITRMRHLLHHIVETL